MSDPDCSVVFRNACKTYGRGKKATRVLNELNMKVPTGSIYGLLGASGCGKTTILGCIAGRLKLDSGELKVLGGTPGTKGSGIPGPRIGYMPQDVSLVGEFNVKDILYYFGWMFGMSSPEIAEQYDFLSKLLELPTDNRRINTLSGGQQRRVSLAAALVQTPELLLLDEPTVGLDPVLRQSIWEYLVKISSDHNMTIIITTHYIEEATQAHKIGLLRGGVLLADAAPASVIAQYNCTTLEEVFLLLSSEQGDKLQDAYQQPTGDVPLESTYEEDGSTGIDTKCTQYPSKARQVSFDETYSNGHNIMKRRRQDASPRSRMKALLYKDFISLIRNYAGLLFLFLFPFIEISIFFVGIGNDAYGMPLGIVNDEYTNCSKMIVDIRNSSGVRIFDDGSEYDCHYYGLSCLFIDMIDEKTVVDIIFYEDQNTALVATKKTRSQSLLYFPSNFSSMLEKRFNEGKNFSFEMVEKSEIKAWVDMSDYLVGYQVKKLFYDTYAKFADSLSNGCKLNRKISHIPIKFNDPVFASNNQSYRDFMAPGIIMLIAYFLSAVITGTNISSERNNGLWDRNLVAGATVVEIIFSHILCNVVGSIIQTAEILLMAFFVYNMESKGSIALVILFVCMQSFAGISYGLCISAACRTGMTAIYMIVGSFLPYTMISGVMWPLEGAADALRYISYLAPGTLASRSLSNVLIKGFGFFNASVIPGFLMSMTWIVVPCILSVLILRKQ